MSATANRCVGEPVSWLRLERYHLGELDAIESARIAEHLATCPACASCLARIVEDEARALPPLEVRSGGAPRGQVVRPARWGRVGTLAGALAVAAVAVLGVGRGWLRSGPDVGVGSSGASRIKGDGIAFSLVRDDDERIVEAGGVFRDGDRFKAVVTCPPGIRAAFDLVVFDEGGASFPLGAAGEIACGNEVPLPGAFRLTGNKVETVCLVWSEGGAVDRAVVAKGAEALGEKALCKRMEAGGGAAP
jgi:hypothetical protein